MIGFFNKLANSWIAKIICAILGLSMMAFWGLGGISITAGSNNTALKIGRKEISMQQLNTALETERNKISQLTGKYISQKQAIENGLLDQAIQQIVKDQLAYQLHEEIGLTASDKAVRKYVERNPAFLDNLGHFDTNLFYAYLGQLKMNQEQLSEKLKEELANQHLTNALMKSVPQEEELIKLAAQSQKETRKISYLLLKQSEIGVDSPSETELKEYYEAYQDNFTTPEYRRIYLASIMPSDFKENKESSYDKMYKTVQELEDLLGAGTPLKEATQKLNLTQPAELVIDISGKNKQGTVADKKLEGSTLLQEVFVLNEKEATSMIEYNNGFIVAEVEEIIPVAFKPFTSVKSDVLALYKQEQQKEKLPKLTERIIQSLKTKKGWGKYVPQTKNIQRNESDTILQKNVNLVFGQAKGEENVQSYPLSNGNLIIVVNGIILSKSEPKAEEKKNASIIWGQDLTKAVQNTLLQDYPVEVNKEAIQKNYSNLLKEE